jgi:hypothetical protein
MVRMQEKSLENVLKILTHVHKLLIRTFGEVSTFEKERICA